MNIAVLNVRFTGDVSGMDRAFSQAQRKTQSFKSSVDKMTNFSINADASAFNKTLDQAQRKAADTRASIVEDLRRIRLAAAQDVTLTITADTSGLREASAEVDRFRTTTRGMGDITVRVRAEASGITESIAALDRLDSKAGDVNSKWAASVVVNSETRNIETSINGLDRLDDAAERVNGSNATVNANVTGVEQGIASLDMFSARANAVDQDDINVLLDLDISGAMLNLGTFDTAAAATAAQDIDVDIDVDAAGALVQLGAVNAAQVTTAGSSALLQASTGTLIAQFGIYAAAIVGATTVLGPFLGAIGAIAGLAVGAVTGLGLIGGAVYVMAQGLYDGGAAMAALSAAAASLQAQLAIALGPASVIVADIGMAAMDVAQNYMPMIGTAGTATALAAQAGLQPLFDWLASQAGMGYFEQIFAGAAPIVSNLSLTVGSLLQGLIAMFATLMPYGVALSETISGVAAAFATWATSAEGSAQITAFVESAIPVFQALWDLVVSVGGALLNFSMVAGGDVATSISVISSVLTGLIDAFTFVYDTVGGAGVAFGLLGVAAAALVPLVMAVGAAFATIGVVGAGVIAAIAGIAAAATLIYNNWGTVGPFLQGVWDGILAGATAAWNAIAPIVTTAVNAVLAVIQSVGTQITTWWSQYLSMLGLDTSTVLSGVSTTVSTILTGVQTAVTFFLSMLTTAWTAGWTLLSGTVSAVWTVLSAVIQGGVTIILGLITGFTGLLTGNWQMAWQGLVMVAQGIWTVISGVVQGGLALIQTIFDTGLALISGTWQSVLGMLPESVQTIINSIIAVFTFLYDTLIGGSIIPDLVNGIVEWFTGIGDAVLGVLQAGIDAIVAAWQAGWDAITSIAQTVWDAITSAVQAGADMVMSTLDSAWALLQSGAQAAWDAFWSIIDTAWSLVVDTVTTWSQAAWDAIEAAWTNISTGAQTAWDNFWTIIDTVWSTVVDTVTTWGQTLWDGIESTWSSIIDGVTTAWDTVTSYIDSAWSTIVDTVVSWGQSLWDSVEETWSNVIGGVSSFAESLSSAIDSAFGYAIGAAGDLLAVLLNGIATALDYIGDPGGFVGSLQSAASTVDAMGYAEGGIPGAREDRVSGRGGVSNSRSPRYHLWAEAGPEAYVAKNGPRRRNMNIVETAANWFGGTVVTGNLDDPAGSREAARAFASGGIVMKSKVTEPGTTSINEWQNTGTSTGDNITITIDPKQTVKSNVTAGGAGKGAGAGAAKPTVGGTQPIDATTLSRSEVADLKAQGWTADPTDRAERLYPPTSGGTAPTSQTKVTNTVTQKTKNMEGWTQVGDLGWQYSNTQDFAGPTQQGATSMGSSTGAAAPRATSATGTTVPTSGTTVGTTTETLRHKRRMRHLARRDNKLAILKKFQDEQGGGATTPGGTPAKLPPQVFTYHDTGHGIIPVIPHQLGDTHWGYSAPTEQLVATIQEQSGYCAADNTYYGHSYRAGCPEEDNVDWWGGARGSQIDYSCGNTINDLALANPATTYTIWQGVLSDVGPWPDDPHYDHVHTAFCGGGGGGRCIFDARAYLNDAWEAAKGVAHGAVDMLDQDPPIESFGNWTIDNPIDAKVQELLALVPSCSGGGGGGGNCADIAQKAVDAYGWGDAACFASLLDSESGCDCGISNTEGSGATGVGQTMPSTYEAYKPSSCGSGDITDCHCNAMASLSYQNQVYGEPKCSGPYSMGGVIPGTLGAPSMALVHAGERVLSVRQNHNLEALADNPAAGGAGGGAYIGGNQNVDNSQSNQIEVNVQVEGGNFASEADRRAHGDYIAEQTVSGVLDAINQGTGANKDLVSQGWS